MQGIDQYSRATVEFTLTWESEDAIHTEKIWADPVSFWRDVLPSELVKSLLGKGVGERVTVEIPAARFQAPSDPRKKIFLRPNQFQGLDGKGNSVLPGAGRFYPQGLLSGVGGVYREITSPCRYLGQQGDLLVFDLNHPLAGRDLKLQAEIVAVHLRQKERGGRCEDWLERVSADGPGMQTRFTGEGGILFAEENFLRADDRADADFYQQPRLVYHLDRAARDEIGRQYAQLIRPGAKVLDLMGSWTSNLPETLQLGSLTVLGLNAEELRHNSRAGQTLVHDLNAQADLPFADASFDAVICTASVEYLINPLAVVAEIRRILRPGGVLALAFSNRWFPPKVIGIWPDLHEFERLGLVADLLHTIDGFSGINTLSRRGLPRPLDDPHQDLWVSDPVYMVWGNKV